MINRPTILDDVCVIAECGAVKAMHVRSSVFSVFCFKFTHNSPLLVSWLHFGLLPVQGPCAPCIFYIPALTQARLTFFYRLPKGPARQQLVLRQNGLYPASCKLKIRLTTPNHFPHMGYTQPVRLELQSTCDPEEYVFPCVLDTAKPSTVLVYAFHIHFS
jgi:apolipoprotein N-acyltransferase